MSIDLQMKKFLLLGLFLFWILQSDAQITCSDLTSFVKTKCKKTSSYCCFDSSFLTNVDFYEVQDDYQTRFFALVTIDHYNEYVYCIPSSVKSDFSLYAYTDQAGEAFHKYIKPYKCNCN